MTQTTTKNIEISGELDYEHFTFSGGEEHVRLTQESYPFRVDLKAYLKSSKDIIILLLVCDAIKRAGGSINKIVIPYFPYARQDRVCNKGEALSVKVMADLINSIEANKIVVWDPHSDVTPALIDNVYVVEQQTIVPQDLLEKCGLVCPDAGAEKKIRKLGKPYLMAHKVRDTKTGEIIRTTIDIDEDWEHERDWLIVDDICDGGRTFIEIAKVLRHMYYKTKTVRLFVTHGIFSKGMEVFEGLIDEVFWYDRGNLKTWSSSWTKEKFEESLKRKECDE